MSDFGLKGVTTGPECAVFDITTKALEALSGDEARWIPIWEVSKYLMENCPEAQGEGSDNFLAVTVARALDQMEQTEVIERRPNGLRLTSVSRSTLLGKGEAPSDKEDADDRGAPAEHPKAATSLRARPQKPPRPDFAPPRAEGESRAGRQPRSIGQVQQDGPSRPAGWGRSDPARRSDSPGRGVRERQPSPVGRNRSPGAGRAEDQPVFGAAWGRGGGDARGGRGAGRPGPQAPKDGTESDFVASDEPSE
jgi:hypothetical protein